MELRGHLDLMLLNSVRQLGSAHGYAIIVALRDGSDGVFDLPEGTVYPALHRLERAGLVDSDWDTSGPRRRRVYRLTPDGSAALAAKRREWQAFAHGMRALIGPMTAEGLA
ncbi:PadR family transcriptional regulator [Actinocatenispora rupis]|uniref:PadR family transcriptional regulator n=1 Tax=Actinocatenispora rupis TaxID=519421 RepID=A0A8J3JGA1_9ACTN|nr:helix-turn-helix transcriptional regulator [Actinocatenispora rupis]GID15388.1 PadR family transcriptional regulator [Actinocatenispora rupis]